VDAPLEHHVIHLLFATESPRAIYITTTAAGGACGSAEVVGVGDRRTGAAAASWRPASA
jgi:hypothetical protein